MSEENNLQNDMQEQAFPSAYLEAKQALDQCSRSTEVENWYYAKLLELADKKGPLDVVEMGAGTLGYLYHAPVPWENVWRYQAYEPSAHLRERASQTTLPGGPKVFIVPGGTDSFLQDPNQKPDAFTAHAFLDLMDPRTFLPRVFAKMPTGSLFYFTLVFDGMSAFLPEHPQDPAMIKAYHQSMRDSAMVRGRDGALTGRRALDYLCQKAIPFIARPTAWQVLPANSHRAQDKSPLSEESQRTFLTQILRYFESALASASVPGWEEWLKLRQKELLDGSLGFLAGYWDMAGVLL
jgi:hypothetical protein